MRLQFENVNTNKLHDELLAAEIVPQLVESLNNTTWITVKENQVDAVNAIVSVHNPAPSPQPKTEIEILKETVDALVLASLEG